MSCRLVIWGSDGPQAVREERFWRSIGGEQGLRLGLDAMERLCGRVNIDVAAYFWLLQVRSEMDIVAEGITAIWRL